MFNFMGKQSLVFIAFSSVLLVFMTVIACSTKQPQTTHQQQQVRRLLMEADTLQKNNPDLVKQHQLVKRALKIAQAAGNDSLISEAYLKLGHYCLQQSNDSAAYYLKKAKQGFRELRLSDRIIRADAGMVNYYSKKAAFKEVTPYLLDAELRIQESTRSSEDHIYFYLQKTIFYHSLGLYDSALITINKGEALCKTIKSDRYLPNLLASRAIVYSILGNFRKSLHEQKRLVPDFAPYSIDRAVMYTNIGNNYARLFQGDSAEMYYRKANHIYTSSRVGSMVLSKFHTTAATSLLDVSKKASRAHFLKIIPEDLNLPNQFYYLYIRANLQATPAQTKQGLLNAIAFADSAGIQMDDLKKDCFYDLFVLAQAEGNASEALKYYQLYVDLNDRVRGQEMSLKLEQLTIVNQIREKETTIKNQGQVIRQKSNTINQQRTTNWLIVVMFVILALTLLMFLLNYRKKVRISALVLKQNQLERELLIGAVSPISNQLENAADILKVLKKELKSESGRVAGKSIESIDQWLLFYNNQNAIVDASKEHERFFLSKLDQYKELSETEKRVAILIRQGLQSKEIAARLNLALNTVEIYRSKIRKKMGIPANEQLNTFLQNL